VTEAGGDDEGRTEAPDEQTAGRPVRIDDYDPRWAAMFEEARAEIVGRCGALVVGVEHIGSTSVPGLAAKPIIDIMAAVESLDDAQALVEPLAALGFEYVPKTDFPGRRFFRRGLRGAGTHHLHVVERGSWEWRRHLLFRDHLRAHPERAAEYERLKRGLAAAHGPDRGAYTDAKTPFIESVVKRAQKDMKD
jgi:GrpB-like predicted nucleotidyltransferase (UPF0157 family)